MTRPLILAIALLLQACAVTREPAPFADYCARHPDRAECGGAK